MIVADAVKHLKLSIAIQNRPRRQRGFTLIELMFVVTIVGILAAIALPAYSDAVIRSRVSEGLVVAAQCRTSVSESFQTGNTSAGVDAWGCDEGRLGRTQFVEVVHTDVTGTIYVTMNPNDPRLGAARGQDIVLRPVIVGGGGFTGPLGSTGIIVGWECLPGITMPPQYLPSFCR